MKSAKKLLLLLLSFVLLIGVFTVAALADDNADVATVVYPDGAVETYAVGETIVPKEMTDGLYYGQGNTLFKDDATAGWIFTVKDGAALADLTVTADMAGKQIIVSGVDQVYSKIVTTFTDTDYYKYTVINGAGKYIKAGTSYTVTNEDETQTTVQSVKRVAGTYEIYFYDAASLEKFFSTNAQIELGGVALNYQDLRAYGATHTATIYADQSVGNLWLWAKDGYDRVSSNGSSVGEGQAAIVYFDLNGHSLESKKTSYNDMRAIRLYVYSSQPNAHFFMLNTSQAFYVNDDSVLYLGAKDASGTYANNLHVHAQTLFKKLDSGGGAYIYGGHYHQSGTASAFVDISGRMKSISNASFYVRGGSAVLGDTSSHNNCGVATGTTINKSNFYSNDASDVLKSTQSTTLKFDNCKFYGVSAEGQETGDAVTYKTVTWADGTVSYIFAETLDEVKDFAEAHPNAKHPAGFYASDDDGKTMYYVANPVSTLTYDDNCNAMQTLDGERATVYYTVSRNGYETYYSLKNNVHTILTSTNFGGGGYDANVTLYSDVNASSFNFGTNSSGIGLNFDMNGHTISVGSVVYITYVSARIYSSVPGAKFISTSSDGTLFYNKSTLILGTSYSGSYAGNVSFYAKAIVGNNDAGNLYVRGGNYYQTGASAIGGLFTLNSKVFEFKNSNVYVQNGQSVFAHNADCVSGTVANGNVAITNCNFYAEGAANLINAAKTCELVFNGCKFINVAPVKTLGVATMYYNGDCYFNLPSGENLYTDETPLYTVRIDPVAVSGLVAADGTPIEAYILYKNADITNTLKISAENTITTYWEIGTTFVASIGEIEKIEGNKLYYNPAYNSSDVAEIVDGKIVAAGEITLAIEFLSDDIAFIYSVNGIDHVVGYNRDCGGTAEGVGDKFYDLFNAPAAGYTIVMYKDMRLTKGVHFGAYVQYNNGDGYNRDYYNSFANGSILWDLNGTTVTIDKDVTNIANLAAANFALTTPGTQNAYNPAVFGFEHPSSSNGLTLKSSKAGAQIINESSSHLFGIGEGRYSTLKIYGENITFNSPLARIITSNEIADGTRHYIEGGTYISGYSSGVLMICGSATVKDATFISTNASAARVVQINSYRSGAVAFNNCTFVSANRGAVAVGGGRSSYSLSFADCTYAMAIPTATSGTSFSAVTYSGTHLVPNAADLSTVYASAPADTTAAASSVKVNGVDYKVYGYFANTNGFVTVEIPLASLTEVWVVGGTFVSPAFNANINVVEKDGKIYYRENPVWVAKISGVIVADILAAANAGKTVVLDVDGALETVYAIRDIAGAKTYYYGENAATELIALFANMGGTNSTITFYEDITFVANAHSGLLLKSGGQSVSHYIDLNGHKITIQYAASVETYSYALYFQNGHTYVYSSAPGAVIEAGLANMLMMTDGAAYAYLGENVNDRSTNYGKNLTVICKSVFVRLWSEKAYILGGTYIQNGTSNIDRMLGVDEGPVPVIRNSTFIADYYLEGFVRCKTGVTVTGCTFIAKNATNLVAGFSGPIGASFKDCYFYNVIPNVPEAATVTYENCYFDTASMIAQNGGYIAFTGENVVKNVNGADYTFAAKFVAEATLVDWGFGIREYWVNGATASHDDIVVDGLFAYGFNSFVVGEGEAKATMIAMKPGTISMFVTLQSKIGVTLEFSADLIGATIKLGAAEVTLTEELLALSQAIAPNAAYGDTVIAIVIGDNTHEISVSLEDYAEILLGSEAYADVHNLTYAMIEYVRAMIPAGKTFCEGVTAPAGYEAQVLVAKESANGEGMLENIAFCLDGTIAIAINGKTEAIGKNVNLVLANGRSETETVNEDGTVLFEGLYVNEFFGEMTITVEGEIYYYSLANYLKGIGGESAAVQALYNYAFYANAYVATLVGAN